jgi:hypothetical protein
MKNDGSRQISNQAYYRGEINSELPTLFSGGHNADNNIPVEETDRICSSLSSPD